MKKYRFLVISYLLSQSIASAQAALTATDNGRYIVDSASHLEWANLHATVGLSINDVLHGAGGWAGEGFRYATLNELDTLLNDAGFPQGGVFASVDYVNQALQFQSLFGITAYNNWYDGQRNDSSGVLNSPDQSGYYPIGTVYVLDYLNGSPLVTTALSEMWATPYALNQGQDNLGNWLVRDAPPVPEPNTIWLLSIGLAVLKLLGSKTAVKLK